MIELRNVARGFQVGDEQVAALRNVNLVFDPGSYVAIMGPSGSGKSTLLNLLGLLDRPDAGDYLLDGVNTTELDDDERAFVRCRKIGFVFQSFHLVPRLTAAENVELPLMLSGGISASDRRQRVAEALDSVGLRDRAHHRPNQLSGGQRQRVAIARAVIMEPAIILADEPTGNLDHTSGAVVVETLEALNRKGIILLVVTHDPIIGGRARRQLHLLDGRVVSDIAAPPHDAATTVRTEVRVAP
jgi:putative ABC transport system ATP-binding protein